MGTTVAMERMGYLGKKGLGKKGTKKTVSMAEKVEPERVLPLRILWRKRLCHYCRFPAKEKTQR